MTSDLRGSHGSSFFAKMLRAGLLSAATKAPIRVFVLPGENAPFDAAFLRLSHGLIFCDSPRSASILLIVGRLPTVLVDAACTVHDGLSHPRRTVWCPPAVDPIATTHDAADNSAALESFVSGSVVVNNITNSNFEEALVARLHEVHGALLSGEMASELDLLPDIDPAQWRGVGPYGQGGTGMTGGVPYGRPLAERARDRDGLELDQIPLRVGPFFAPFPSGLVLDVKLQGDLVQEVGVASEPSVPLLHPFDAALHEKVSVAAVEMARAQSHLTWAAHALRIHGLDALGERALGLARRCQFSNPPTEAEVKSLELRVRRSGLLALVTRSIAIIDSDNDITGLGPVARAAGLKDDARENEAAYATLGFETLVQNTDGNDPSGDASARWRQRFGEILQSLDLAKRAGSLAAWGNGVVEGPRGRVDSNSRPEKRLYELLPSVLNELEWGDAVTAVISLDLGTGCGHVPAVSKRESDLENEEM